MIRVWDPVVRVIHWVVALGFLVAYVSEGEPLLLHVWAGYVVGVLVVLRILWGLVGPRYARLGDFLCGPGRVIAYLRDLLSLHARRYLGHSPAGGAMAIALWIGLIAVVWSGLEVYAIENHAGPLAALSSHTEQVSAGTARLTLVADNDEENGGRHGPRSVWRDIHELTVNVVLVLVILHLAGVALASFAHRENLTRAMITGLKREG